MAKAISFPAVTVLVDDDADSDNIREIMTGAIGEGLLIISETYPCVYRLDPVKDIDLNDKAAWAQFED